MANEKEVLLQFVVKGINEVKTSMTQLKKPFDELKKVIQHTNTSVKALGKNLNNLNLKGLGNEAKEAGDGVEKAGNAADKLNNKLGNTGKKAEKASTGIKKTRKSLFSLYGVIAQVTASLGILSAALIKMGKTSLEEGLKFEQAMRNVNSIAQVSEKQFAQLSEGAREVAKRLDVRDTATGVANAMYTLVSSGIEVGKALDVAAIASRAASAGMTDTQTAVKGLAALMNSYNEKTVQDAIKFSDQLFAVVDKGVLSFEGLANNLGSAIAVAAPMGVAFKEVGGAFIELTRHGISVAEAETAVASLIRQLGAPTKESLKNVEALNKALQATGSDFKLEIGETALQAKGLEGVLNDVAEATGGSSQALKKILPDFRGFKAALILASEGGEQFKNMILEVETASEGIGKTQRALNQQMQSLMFSIDQLKAFWADLKIEVTAFSSGALRPVIDMFKALINWFMGLKDSTKQAIVTFGIVATVFTAVAAGVSALILVFTPLLGLLGSIAGAFTLATTETSVVLVIFWKLVAVLTPFSALILGLISTVGSFALVFVGLYQNVEEVEQAVKDFGTYLKDKFGATLSWIGKQLRWAADGFIAIGKGAADTSGIKRHKEEVVALTEEYRKLANKGYKFSAEQLRKYGVALRELALTEKGIERENLHAEAELLIVRARYLEGEAKEEKDGKGKPPPFLSSPKKLKKGNEKELAALERKLTEERIKNSEDEFGYKRFLAVREFKERKDKIDAWKHAEGATAEEVKSFHERKDEAVRESYENLKNKLIEIAQNQNEALEEENDKAFEIARKQYEAEEKRKLKLAKQAEKEDDKAFKLAKKLANAAMEAKNKQAVEAHAKKQLLLENDTKTQRLELRKQKAGRLDFLKFEKKTLKAQADLYKKQAEDITLSYKQREEARQKLFEVNISLAHKEIDIEEELVARFKEAISIGITFGQKLSESNNKIVSSFGGLVTATGDAVNTVVDLSTAIESGNWLQVAAIAAEELGEMVAEVGDAFNQLFEDLSDDTKDAGEAYLDFTQNLVYSLPILGDIAKAWDEVANAISRAIANALGFLTTEQMKALTEAFAEWLEDGWQMTLRRAQEHLKLYETMVSGHEKEIDRLEKQREDGIKELYRLYKQRAKSAYDYESDLIDRQIDQLDGLIEEQQEKIDGLRDQLDALQEQPFKISTLQQFQQDLANLAATIDPDFFREPITRFELDSKAAIEAVQLDFIQGKISEDEMNKKLMADALERNLYYSQMADNLVDGTREQFEMQQLANQAYEDYARLVQDKKALEIEGDIKEAELVITKADGLADQKEDLQDELKLLKDEYDEIVQGIEDIFKDPITGEFRELAALDLMYIEGLILDSATLMKDSLTDLYGDYKSYIDNTTTEITDALNSLPIKEALLSSALIDEAMWAQAVKEIEDFIIKYTHWLNTGMSGEPPNVPNIPDFEFEGFATGGVSSGPTSGYPILAHGTEMHLNERQINNLFDMIRQPPAMNMSGGGGINIYFGNVTASDPKDFIKQVAPALKQELARSYRNAYTV